MGPVHDQVIPVDRSRRRDSVIVDPADDQVMRRAVGREGGRRGGADLPEGLGVERRQRGAECIVLRTR